MSLSVVLLIALLLASPVAALAQSPRAERPTYSVGDRWILDKGAYDLIRIENDLYVFAREGGFEIYLSKDLALVKSRGPQRFIEF